MAKPMSAAHCQGLDVGMARVTKSQAGLNRMPGTIGEITKQPRHAVIATSVLGQDKVWPSVLLLTSGKLRVKTADLEQHTSKPRDP